MNELLSLLGLALRAKMLSIGFDSVKDSTESGKARLVFFAQDLSPKTEKEARFFLSKKGIPSFTLEANINELGQALGKKVGIVSINDTGFAKRAEQLYKAQNGRRTQL